MSEQTMKERTDLETGQAHRIMPDFMSFSCLQASVSISLIFKNFFQIKKKIFTGYLWGMNTSPSHWKNL